MYIVYYVEHYLTYRQGLDHKRNNRIVSHLVSKLLFHPCLFHFYHSNIKNIQLLKKSKTKTFVFTVPFV